jgi:hypothetical protein
MFSFPKQNAGHLQCGSKPSSPSLGIKHIFGGGQNVIANPRKLKKQKIPQYIPNLNLHVAVAVLNIPLNFKESDADLRR